MKSNILNTVLKILFLLSATYCAWMLIAPLLGMAAGKRLNGHEWQSWIGSVAGSALVTLFAYIVWHTVNMLTRVEEQQERIAQAVETLSRRLDQLGDKPRMT